MFLLPETRCQLVSVLHFQISLVRGLVAANPPSGKATTEFRLSGLGAITHAVDASVWKNIVLLSGGTDGEDGPTDAAGALADAALVADMNRQNLSPASFLMINNSYPFFQQLNGLLHTGPTHTNVMDLAVGIVGQAAD